MTISEHLFQEGRYLTFSGGTNWVKFYDDSADEIRQSVFPYVSYKPLYKKYTSDINGKVILKKLGYVATVEIEIDIVNDAILEAVGDLFALINATPIGGITIYPGGKSGEIGNSVENCYLSGDITPEYLERSLMSGENLKLEFESTKPAIFLPAVKLDYDRIAVKVGGSDTNIKVKINDIDYLIKVR